MTAESGLVEVGADPDAPEGRGPEPDDEVPGEPHGGAPEAAPARAELPGAVWLAAVLVVLAVVPILVSGVNGLTRPWFPAGDWAMTELRVLDVGTAHTPLVGAYSRYHWNHPGPFLFWLLAVPYRLSGRSSSSLLLGAALLNAASVAGAAAFAWRRGRLPLVAGTVLVFSIVAQSMGAAQMRDPWNAWVTVLPFGLAVLAAWSAWEGDRWGLPVLAGVGAFLVQSHIGFAPLVGVLTVVAVVGGYRRSGDRRNLLVAAVVAAVCWSPVVADVLTGGDNLGRIIGYFVGGDVPATGARVGVGVAALELGLHGPWAGAPEIADPNGGGLEPGSVSGLVVSLLAFGVATLIARRMARRAGDASRFLVVVGVAAAVGLVAVSRISETVFDYLVRWWWPLAALWWLAVAWALWSSLGERARPLLRTAAVVVVALVLVGRYALDTSGQAAQARLPVDDWGPSMEAVTAAGADQVPRGRPVLVRNIGPLAGWAGDAFAVRLARLGVDIRVDGTDINPYKFGSHRIGGSDPAVPAVWVVTGSFIDDFVRQGAARELARYDPLTPEDRAWFRDEERRLRAQLAQAGRTDLVHNIDDGASLWFARDVSGVDEADLARYDELRARGVAVAVFLMDRSTDALPDHVPG